MARLDTFEKRTGTRRRATLWTLAAIMLATPALSMADDTGEPTRKLPFNARKVDKVTLPKAKALSNPARVSATAVQDRPAVKKPEFRFEGEELYFQVEVSGTDAARASIRAGKRQTARGVSYVPVSAKAITHGFFAKSYPLDNKADTFINTRTLQPIKSDKIIKEKGESRTYKVRYDPKTFSARVNKELTDGKQKKTKTYDRAVPSSIHDGISWLYELRMEKLNNGDVYTYYIYDGWKLSRLKVTVKGREKAWTPIKEWGTIKVDIEREVLNSRWPKGTDQRTSPRMTRRQKPYYFATIHLSDDNQRVPVRLFVTSKQADSEFKLVKYVPASK